MVKIIVEFCQNHLGSKDLLQEMISVAKSSGATYAKIQGLYSHELTERIEFENPDGIIFRPFREELNRLSKLDLDFEVEKWFVSECLKNSIIPMITVFSHYGVERASKAGFKHIKIASYDCSSIPLISKVLKFASELVVSTGATDWQDICNTANYISRNKSKNQDITFLHATTIYPTPLNKVSLLKMTLLGVFDFNTGYSDHTNLIETGLCASKTAIALGAKFIERHFTVLDPSMTKDGPISITGKEVSELVNFSKLTKIEQLAEINSYELEKILRLESLNPSELEMMNRSYYRGRVASTINGTRFNSWEEI